MQKLGDKTVGGNNSVYTPNETHYKIASAMVAGSVIKRRNEQSVNWYMLSLAIVTLIGLPMWWVSAINKKAHVAELARHSNVNQYEQALGTKVSVGNLGGISAMPTIPNNPIGQSHATPTPQQITVNVQYPTPQPTIQVTPTVYSVQMVFKYSYYNPKLGGINCAVWDEIINDCISPLSNGEDYHNNYGISLACPPDIALGTVFDVTYPEDLRGQWICKDRGGAIVNDYVDFLDLAQRVEWNSVIVANLYPPDTPMMQVSGNSH